MCAPHRHPAVSATFLCSRGKEDQSCLCRLVRRRHAPPRADKQELWASWQREWTLIKRTAFICEPPLPPPRPCGACCCSARSGCFGAVPTQRGCAADVMKTIQVAVMGIVSATLWLRTQTHPTSTADGFKYCSYIFFTLIILM